VSLASEAGPPLALSRVGTSILRSARPHPISEVDAVRSSKFSSPTFPHRTRQGGAPFFLAGVRLSGLAPWETQDPSTALGMTGFVGALPIASIGRSEALESCPAEVRADDFAVIIDSAAVTL